MKQNKNERKNVDLKDAENIVEKNFKEIENESSGGIDSKNDRESNGNQINDDQNPENVIENIGDVSNQENLIKQTSSKNNSKNFIDRNHSPITEHLTPQNNSEASEKTSGCITDEDIIKLLKREKKTIDFKNQLFLSPLTTVGNLPFRRICKEYGADITCGEMAMCSSLLQGAPQEWALVKRHASEKVFGVQLCANNPHLLTKCAQLLENEAEIDFVDLNLGCPIELVYRQGGGCGLLRRSRVLEACVRGLSGILSVPLTIKTRTGVYSDESVAHELVSAFFYVSCLFCCKKHRKLKCNCMF